MKEYHQLTAKITAILLGVFNQQNFTSFHIEYGFKDTNMPKLG
ncbi:hypothetical protein HMPREF1287_00246 [Corynebacterium sp. KPL1986]|nr:hypothetical protein HMPREF0277_1066 [Corynebacterium accolens ATCC 49726]ERS42478.1 hypothetical protein HMPREF1293_01070 [Corynebacterium sp. KPL1996]ERS45810.1 hypothetical protein HMPREF1287_00246 [Corynebacterium sp. KPL1986]ERS70203.1 hypothetical protein HMPREF1300_01878 [Corynebacterium sp. KPL2004]ERS70628.1 hypothetical protein HMPREF1295_01849 [Corynebacterium sp. KPL1998]